MNITNLFSKYADSISSIYFLDYTKCYISIKLIGTYFRMSWTSLNENNEVIREMITIIDTNYDNLAMQIQTYPGLYWLQKAYVKSLRNLECKTYEEKNVARLNLFLDLCFKKQTIMGEYVYADILHTRSNDTTNVKYSVFYDKLKVKNTETIIGTELLNKSYIKFYFIFALLMIYYIFSVYDYINYLGIIHIRYP